MSCDEQRGEHHYSIAVFFDDPRTAQLLFARGVEAPTNKQCRREWARMLDLRDEGNFSTFWAMFEKDGQFVERKMVAAERVEFLTGEAIQDSIDNARALHIDYHAVCRTMHPRHEMQRAGQDIYT